MALLKCTICGFKENDSQNINCDKCGEPLKNSIDIVEPIITSTDDTYIENGKVELKKTRILEIEKGQEILNEDVLKASVNIEEDINVGKEITEEPVSIHPKKQTLYIDEFNPGFEDVEFKLIPLGEINQPPLKIRDTKVTLSRQDIDREDMSISGGEHVKFEKTKKGWVMKNISSNGAVFIRVEDEILLKDNDIVIIGKHKTFLFKEK